MSATTCDVDCIDHAAASKAREVADALTTTQALPLLRAIADPIRLRLLAAAVEQPDLCACDLAWVVDRQKSLVSHHLRRLRETGLLEVRRDGRLMRYRPTPTGTTLLRALTASVGKQVAA